jgi:hypothetical protein
MVLLAPLLRFAAIAKIQKYARVSLESHRRWLANCDSLRASGFAQPGILIEMQGMAVIGGK